MLRVPVTFWKNGKKIGEKLFQKDEVLKIKQQARRECYSHLDWDSIPEEFTHVIYYKGYYGYRIPVQMRITLSTSLLFYF